MRFATGAAEAAAELGYHLLLSPESADSVEELRYLTGVTPPLPEGSGFSLSPAEVGDGQALPVSNKETITGKRFPCRVNPAVPSPDLMEVRLADERTDFLLESGTREAGLWYAGDVRADTAGEGRLAFERLMAEHPEVTAVAAMSDQAAVGVLQAVEERGWRVPGDLSLLLASASARVAEMFRPRLTTLEPPGAELGRLGARMLIDRLESPGSPPAQRLVPCRLVIGDSSAPPRGSGAAR